MASGEKGKEGAEAEKAAAAAPASAKAGAKRAKGKPGKAKASGRVVATGLDVPKLDNVLKAPEPDNGRPTDYRPEYAATARAMCKLGATDMELAEEFEVKTSTIWRWRSKFPEFCSALLEGKEAFDDRIERSLAQRAAGYTFHSQKVFNYEGGVVRADTIEHIPPDVGACKLWLHNRRPDTWREKSEIKLDSDGAFLKLWEAISDGAI